MLFFCKHRHTGSASAKHDSKCKAGKHRDNGAGLAFLRFFFSSGLASASSSPSLWLSSLESRLTGVGVGGRWPLSLLSCAMSTS